MRFVARLAIAIATLLGSAILCWGQMPAGAAERAQPSARSFWPRMASKQPGLTPPQSEGTWVDDSAAMPEAPDPTSFGGLPIEMAEQGGGDADSRMSGACPNCGSDVCDGSCDGGAGGLGDGGPLGGLGPHHHPFVTTDLWCEVHAHRRTWFSIDYLSMWAKGNPLPPLVTTSPIGTPQAQAGVLPESANTTILFGNQRVDTDQRNGGRINVVYWLVDGEFWGIEGQYLTLQPEHTTFNHTSIFSDGIMPGDIILARPFFNVDPSLVVPRQDASIVAFNGPPPPVGVVPFVFNQGGILAIGPLDGTINIKTTSNVQSAGALLRKLIWIDFTKQCRLDLLLGYRFFRLDDSVIIDDSSTLTAIAGNVNRLDFVSQDVFSAKNQFHGGEIGAKYQHYHGPVSLELIGKCAFGNNRETMFINGSNTITATVGADTASATTAGGLLAQPTNIGTYRRDVFAVLPEANANLRFDITPNLRATLGYTFIYTNRVQRSGDAIDTTINGSQIGGGPITEPLRPAFGFMDTSFWVHGVSSGIEYRW